MADDYEVLFGVGLGARRCSHCDDVHVALLDEDNNALAEVAMEDADVFRFAVELLELVCPSDKLSKLKLLAEQIDDTGAAKH
jgi:hypothetical protein